jgi:hypothetical protein
MRASNETRTTATRRRLGFALAGVALLIPSGPAAANHAPVYGFGTSTPGGAGQPVYTVTSLADSGPGTLRDALSRGNRNIRFAVSGTITLSSALRVVGSFVTIDGASAPPPGITIVGRGVTIRGGVHDIRINNLRIRNAADDCLNVWENAFNVVIEHVSATGCGDGSIDITQGAHDVTVAWSILNAASPADPQSKTQLVRSIGANTRSITLHHNLYISDGTGRSTIRNPDIGRSGDPASTSLMADVRYNVIWDWGSAGSGTVVRDGAWANVIGNLYSTPGESLSRQNKHVSRVGSVQLHTSGNVSLDDGTVDPDTIGNRATAFPVPYSPTAETACQAATDVAMQVGAQPRADTDAAFVGPVNLLGC